MAMSPQRDVSPVNFVTFSISESDTFTDLKGFLFDWTQRSSSETLVVGTVREGIIAGLVEFERRRESLANYMWLIEVSSEYRGSTVAGELLAYVGRDSLEQGFEGFFFFEPKTILYQFYQAKYGAIPSSGRFLYFDTAATNALIARYLPEESQ
ncbi:MAG: hypothetical protein FWG25_06910 [Promicromonosporaceae bacterium]|nr:hypothetical protein [Promicromonosporaceae bacterium]